MTTTEHLTSISDYEECIKDVNINNINTNKRYPYFKQKHFTAGDESQFELYRCYTNGSNDSKQPILNLDFNFYDKYKQLDSDSVLNTFNYMFHKFKKGIYVKILDNKLKVFLPFSNARFINEWSSYIKVSPQFSNMNEFVKYINGMNNKRYKVNVNNFVDKWYANNCLLRYEFPIHEGDTNVSQMRDMLIELCKNRDIPDIEFFINRRDFPLLTNNSTEAYNHIFGKDKPLLSHNYEKYSPILSMVSNNDYADIAIPTGDDWERVSRQDGKYFSKRNITSDREFSIKWKDKIPTAIFRGSSTGAGVTVDTNPRLKIAYLSVLMNHTNGTKLLDAKITKWQLRPRKLMNEKYLQTINVYEMRRKGITLGKYMSPLEQSRHKYIVHVDGHVSAFRLSIEMSMGSCLLLVKSKYNLWFSERLKSMVHYIPIKEDLSDLISKIKWCRENDEECEKIANNAKIFYNKYLKKDGIFDYMQTLLVNLKKHTGCYMYNIKSPLQIQLENEKNIDKLYPKTLKSIHNINKIPNIDRNYGLLKGLEYIVNMTTENDEFEEAATFLNNICTTNNDTVIIDKYNLAGFDMAVKKSTEQYKINENIHETFVGLKCINSMSKYIPNFAYIFGSYRNNVILEYIKGKTFKEWIDTEFDVDKYVEIMIQLSLALTISFRKIGFIHWDLTPWNIMIRKLETKRIIEYDIDNVIYKIETNLIPVIIDYGKSHVIHDNIHYGYDVNMYKTSSIQDVISILITSMDSIIKKNNWSFDILSKLIYISNFISNTKYRPRIFKMSGQYNTSDLTYFLTRNKKHSELIYSNKYQLEDKTSFDFFLYIDTENTVIKDNNYTTSNIYCNPNQIFHYILSDTLEDKINSYITVFHSLDNYDLFIKLKHSYLKFLNENNKTIDKSIDKYQKKLKKTHNNTLLRLYNRSNSCRIGECDSDDIDKTHIYKTLDNIHNWRHILSPFYKKEFVVDGKKWQTIEHYYQACKFKNSPKIYNQLSLDSKSSLSKYPSKAKSFGSISGIYRGKQIRESHIKFDPSFNHNKSLDKAISERFNQSNELRNILLETHNSTLFYYDNRKLITCTNLMKYRDALQVIKNQSNLFTADLFSKPKNIIKLLEQTKDIYITEHNITDNVDIYKADIKTLRYVAGNISKTNLKHIKKYTHYIEYYKQINKLLT